MELSEVSPPSEGRLLGGRPAVPMALNEFGQRGSPVFLQAAGGVGKRDSDLFKCELRHTLQFLAQFHVRANSG